MSVNGRRYLKFREFVFVQTIAQRLSQRQISPNQISITSIFLLCWPVFVFWYYRTRGRQGNGCCRYSRRWLSNAVYYAICSMAWSLSKEAKKRIPGSCLMICLTVFPMHC